MREFITVPNMVTGGNLTAGFLALLSAQTNLLLAVILVAFAAGLDSVDGIVARRSASNALFGANLDSLADLVSFGVVPALALYVGLVHTLSVLGLAVCLGFLLCGAWRLARFPMVKQSRCFVGLPIPPAGLAVMLLAVWGTSPALALLVTFALSLLMVSDLPFPTLPFCLECMISIPRRSANRWFPRH